MELLFFFFLDFSDIEHRLCVFWRIIRTTQRVVS